MKTCSRIRLIPVCFLFALCLLLPGLAAHPVPAAAETYLKVAVLEEPNNLNPFQTSDIWTKKVTGLIYQPLYLVDQDNQTFIPWLAEDQPVYDPENGTVVFHLRETCWDDGAEFTAEDVVFTAKIFKKIQIPRYYPYWKFVEKIESPDNRTVRMTLAKPTAVFSRRGLTTFIVQKKKWEPLLREAEKQLKDLGSAEGGKKEPTTEARTKGLEKALEACSRITITSAHENFLRKIACSRTHLTFTTARYN